MRDNPITQTFYESLDIDCVTTPTNELYKAAGSIGCLTGILERKFMKINFCVPSIRVYLLLTQRY